MSLSLVSQCLDLDLDTEGVQKNKQDKTKKKDVKTKNAMDLIKTDRQGVWKELRKLQKKEKRAVVDKRKKKKLKSGLEKYKEEYSQDYTEVNVEALKRITELGKVDSSISEKILFKQPCMLSRDMKDRSKEDESTVFTDEDFDKFAREYKSTQS